MALKLNGLKTFRAGLPDAVDAGAGQAAAYVADLASQFAPYDEAADHKHLNESIVAERNPNGGWQVVAGRGLPDIRASAQEFGTYDQPAQPYLLPAAKEIDVKVEIAKQITALAERSRA